METYFSRRISIGSWLFLVFYCTGLVLNLFSCFVGFWMIKGYLYSLGNTVIFMSALMYALGLTLFNCFVISAPAQIDLVFKYA
jgi:hypothetical protein